MIGDPALTITIGVILVCILVIIAIIAKIMANKARAEVERQMLIVADELDRQKSENLNLRKEMKELTSQAQILSTTIIRLASKSEWVDIGRELANFAGDSLNAEEIAIFFKGSDKGQNLSIVAHKGLNENWLPRIVYGIGEGKVGKCAEARLPIGRREADILRVSEPFVAFDPDFCYPISCQEELFGVVALTRRVPINEQEKNTLGVVTAIAGIVMNNSKALEKERKAAASDPLTRLANIAHFRDRLEDEVARARRLRHSLSVAIIDLDRFKQYNDSYGHHAGDQLLMQLAAQFKQHFRATDLIARYGGDEFIVMMPELKKEEATQSLESLLHALALCDFSRDRVNQVSFSAGVSCFPEDSSHYTELIKCADKALYDAKGSGRNQVRKYSHRIEELK